MNDLLTAAQHPVEITWNRRCMPQDHLLSWTWHARAQVVDGDRGTLYGYELKESSI